MGSTLEMTVVGVVVGAALIWAIIAGWRSVKKKGVCSSCSSSGECPIANNPEALAELGRKVRPPAPRDPADNGQQDPAK